MRDQGNLTTCLMKPKLFVVCFLSPLDMPSPAPGLWASRAKQHNQLTGEGPGKCWSWQHRLQLVGMVPADVADTWGPGRGWAAEITSLLPPSQANLSV